MSFLDIRHVFHIRATRGRILHLVENSIATGRGQKTHQANTAQRVSLEINI